MPRLEAQRMLARATLALTSLAALLAGAAPPVPGAPAKTAAQSALAKKAPADQYFGKLKLSFLGIDNTFRDTGISAGAHTTDPSLLNRVDFAIDALNDWQRKFPEDPQLARSYFLAQITLKKIWIESYQDKAWAYMQHIVQAYPATFYGKTVKADIARGFTRHFYGPAVACDASASPAPSVTSDNGKYKTTIETPPCITPSPSPSPSPEPSAAPAVTYPASPAASGVASALPLSPPPVAQPALSPSPVSLPSASAQPGPTQPPVIQPTETPAPAASPGR